MDKKQIPVLLMVLGIAAAVLVYVLYFQPKMKEVAALKEQDRQLEARIAELEALRDQRDFFIEETERYTQKVEEIYDLFPENVMAEDAIREGIDLEDKAGSSNISIDYSEAEVIYNPIGVDLASLEAVQAANAPQEPADDNTTPVVDTSGSSGNADSGYSLMQQDVTYVFKGDLDQFQKAAMTVNSTGQRDVIKLVAMAYDETEGLLTTQMNISKYYVTGRGLEYSPASYSVPTGSNLFSTRRVTGGGSSGGESDGGATPPAD